MANAEPIPLPDDLPTQVTRVLTDFVNAAPTEFAAELRSISFRQASRPGPLRIAWANEGANKRPRSCMSAHKFEPSG